MFLLPFSEYKKYVWFGIGALCGILFMIASVCLIVLFGGAEVVGFNPEFSFTGLAVLIGIALTKGSSEEILFRGVVQGVFKHAYGRWTGIFLSALLLFLLHSLNPGSAKEWLSGGTFGLEGSLVPIGLLIFLSIFVATRLRSAVSAQKTDPGLA